MESAEDGADAGRDPTVPAVLVALALLSGAHAQPFDGLTLYNGLYNRATKLINNSGQTVKSWNCATTIAYVPYLMPDSTLWRPGVYPGASMRGGVYGGQIEHYAWNGNIIESFIWSDSNHQQHHDIHPMDNGHVLVLAWERKTMQQAQAMGRVVISGEMWPEEIIEYDPAADSAVWRWRVWDHVIQDVDSAKPNYGVVRDHPELVDINLGTLFSYGDWIHANIVEHNEQRDEIVFSSHFLNEIYVIDHSTTTEQAAGHSGGRHGKGGDILYRWGNPQNYRRGDSTDQHFWVVHGANWIAPGLRGAGNILVFNNGDRPGTADDYSSVEEITPPLDSNDDYYIHPDSAFGPEAPGWTYSNPGTFFSGHMSGAYRLPNDNTFICEAVSGRLSEVTYDKQVVWQYNAGAWTGRALKYPRDFTGVGEKCAVRMPNVEVSPNPFGRSATIRYQLPSASGVELTVHDATGRVVARLADCVQPAGAHEARFAGSRLPAGVYFARLETTPLNGSTTRLIQSRPIVKGK